MPSQYATADELKQLGLPPEALEDVDDADIDAQLQASAGTMDSYLSSRYALPIASPYPSGLKRCNVDIAVFHILMRRGFNPEEYDENYKLLHDSCMEWLKNVRDGKLNIPDLIDSTPNKSEAAPAFSSNALRGWGYP